MVEVVVGEVGGFEGDERKHAEDLGNFRIFLTIPKKLCCDYGEPHVKNSPAADAN